jgi:hypothetical protein
MLLASVLAGFLWDGIGASGTFVAGAVFSALAVIVLLAGRGPAPSNQP